MKAIRIENLLRSTEESIRVYWEINLRCNYDCTNCPPDVHSRTEPFPEGEKYFKSLDTLKRILNSKKEIHWALSGGEPTINPYFSTILKEILDPSLKSSSIEIDTNLSLPVVQIENMIRPAYEKLGRNLCLVTSFHHPYTSPKKFKDKLIHLREKFPEVELYPVLLLPLESAAFNETVKLHNDIKGFTNSDLRLIRKDLGSQFLEYSDEQMGFMRDYFATNSSEREDSLRVHLEDGSTETLKSPPSLIERNMVNFKGWLCEAGFSEIVIDTSFNVHRASCTKGGESMGRLFDENFALYSSAYPCPKTSCTCTPNICINKWAP